MWRLLAALVLPLLFVFEAQASRIPFNRETLERFKNVENQERLLKIPFSFTDSPLSAAQVVDLGFTVPSDYLITSFYTYVDTDVVSANSNTVAVGCETSTDLQSANNFADDSEHAVVAGAVTGPANAIRTDGCDLQMTIGAGASGITAGRLIFNIKLQKIENNQAFGKIDLEP
jgi:hypothetical protein